MPNRPVYQFIPAPPGQTQTARELQRAVRSYAASVSRPDPNLVIRRRTQPPKLGEGESVIVFNPEPAGASAAAPIVPIERKEGQGHETEQPDLDSSEDTSNISLFIDILSGHTFSPISHLATFRKPYLAGVINHYIHNLTTPTPDDDDDDDDDDECD